MSLLHRVERRSRVLPRAPFRRQFTLQGRLVLEEAVENPRRALRRVPDPAPGESSHLDRVVTRSLALSVSQVRLAKLGGGLVRLRGFYPAEGVTVVMHQRRRRTSSGLLRGVRAQRLLAAVASYQVPEVREVGSWRSLDWVVENLVQGLHPAPADQGLLAVRLLQALIATSTRAGVEHECLGRWVGPHVTGTIDALLHHDWVRNGGLVPDPDSLVDRVRHLLARGDDRIAVSLCHGDPVFSNVLATADGGLALVDWEHAGRLPVAQDIAKVLVGLEPRTSAPGRRRRVERVGRWRPGLATTSRRLAVSAHG